MPPAPKAHNATIARDPIWNDLLAGQQRLSGVQRLGTKEWIATIDPSNALVVQVGANDHAKGSGYATQMDPGPIAVSAGWKALLLEPVSDTCERLRSRYAENASQVRVVHAGVCDSCASPTQTIYSVDVTNATGNWGSDTADARCVMGRGGWLTEVASLSLHHLVKHQGFLRQTEKLCKACSKQLGRALPGNCLSQVIRKNMRKAEMNCFCFERELATQRTPVSLLVVDAEGHDDRVLEQYPWREWPPFRVVYEQTHIGETRHVKTMKLLRSHGYENVHGWASTAYLSAWHLVNSSEVVRSDLPPPQPRRRRGKPSASPPPAPAPV